MSLLRLVEYADGQGLGKQGSTLFIGEAPAKVLDCVLFRQFGGAVDPELPGINRLSFQVAVRSSSYAAGDAKAEQVSQMLFLRQQGIGSAWFFECYPRHKPMYLETKEESGFYTFVVNFDAVWRLN